MRFIDWLSGGTVLLSGGSLILGLTAGVFAALARREARTRIEGLPKFLLRVGVAWTIPDPAAAKDLLDEWLSELHDLRKATKGKPLTRFIRALWFAIHAIAMARRSWREAEPAPRRSRRRRHTPTTPTHAGVAIDSRWVYDQVLAAGATGLRLRQLVMNKRRYLLLPLQTPAGPIDVLVDGEVLDRLIRDPVDSPELIVGFQFRGQHWGG